MQDWGAPTGSLPVVRELLGLQSFSPQTLSVRAARRFVQECLTGTSMESLAEDAGLLVCELAANAVLHARTDFDVAVSALQDGFGVRVTVRDDAAALPTVTAPSATAMSGRGLALVQTLASRWGAGPSSSARKGVWFELHLDPDSGALDAGGAPRPSEDRASRHPSAGEPELSVEELLAAWSDGERIPAVPAQVDAQVDASDDGAERLTCAPERVPLDAAGERQVVLPGLDAADLLAAKESMDDVLRELQLVLLGPRDQQHHLAPSGPADGPTSGAAFEGLELAHRLDAAARAFDAVRRQVRQQVSLAVATGQVRVHLRLVLPAGTQRAALEYMAAVEAAETLAERGVLLGAGASTLRSHRAVRRAYLGEVIAAAGS